MRKIRKYYEINENDGMTDTTYERNQRKKLIYQEI